MPNEANPATSPESERSQALRALMGALRDKSDHRLYQMSNDVAADMPTYAAKFRSEDIEKSQFQAEGLQQGSVQYAPPHYPPEELEGIEDPTPAVALFYFMGTKETGEGLARQRMLICLVFTAEGVQESVVTHTYPESVERALPHVLTTMAQLSEGGRQQYLGGILSKGSAEGISTEHRQSSLRVGEINELTDMVVHAIPFPQII